MRTYFFFIYIRDSQFAVRNRALIRVLWSYRSPKRHEPFVNGEKAYFNYSQIKTNYEPCTVNHKYTHKV